MDENIMQQIPVKGSYFENLEIAGKSTLDYIRNECESILPQMYHCKQCRVDAIGTLDNDCSLEYRHCGKL